MRTPVKLTRYASNPILRGRGDETLWDGKGVSNATPIYHDGKIHLLYRGEGIRPRQPGSAFWQGSIGHAVSDDGFHFTDRSEKPVLDITGEDPMLARVTGAEDPRISKIGDTYYIVYAVTSDCWDRLCWATTKDFKTYTKHGILKKDIAQRTGALFPEKINNEFLLLHRPIPNIWLSRSSDLQEWHDTKMILTNEVLPWTNLKLGVCGVPIRTEKAWAVIFHGVDLKMKYRLGIFWLDLEDPSKVLYVQPEPILEPETDYELSSLVPEITVVYSCGQIIKDGQVIVYYGAGDSTLCAATMPQEMLEYPF